ncbi:MAG TPA: VOC family protein [Stenotrophomonas sp.]|nr:VOC family protein [Stenotrophomonas sp.]
MSQRLALTTLVVRDYDEALAWYRDVLGFRVLSDQALGEGKRWIVVAPRSEDPTGLLLAQASDAHQRSRVGDQTGGRVGFFLHTDDFWYDYKAMRERGVEFLENPREEAYGIVAVFRDLYGNTWDLLEPRL